MPQKLTVANYTHIQYFLNISSKYYILILTDQHEAMSYNHHFVCLYEFLDKEFRHLKVALSTNVSSS